MVLAHSSGTSRFSPRIREMAQTFAKGGLATLLLDLLTRDEEAVDQHTGQHSFDIARLGRRAVAVVDWTSTQPRLAGVPVVCFGVGTGAAAALVAAAERSRRVKGVIGRSGRPDLAGEALARVQAPTLLIVGGADKQVLELNRAATRHMRVPVQIEVVPGATHLFEQPGALDHVSQLALKWCWRHLYRMA
jgi:dienelactone hydrolase